MFTDANLVTPEVPDYEPKPISKRFECRPCSGTGAKIIRKEDGTKEPALCGCCWGEGFRVADEEQLLAAAAIGSDNPFCTHDWSYTGTAYGGDDESYHGEGRAYCSLCGADGDA